MKMDRFKISVRLRHSSLDPSEITRVFDHKPSFSWKAGSRAGKVVHKQSVWYGLLAEGAGSDEYEEALTRSVLLLESRQEWLNDVFKCEDDIDVIFAYWTELDEGKICQTDFYPKLLARLSNLNAGMQVEVWRDEKEGEASD